MTVYTVGHSTRTALEFIRLLKAHQIGRVIDIRAIPQSAHNPQFGRARLSSALHNARIHYRHLPQLGGRRRPKPDSVNAGWRHPSFRGYADYMQTFAFEANLERVVSFAEIERIALMCAEAVPWRCHRSLVADALVAKGIEVQEISSPARTTPHRLTPWAHVENGRVTYPPAIAGDALVE